MDIGNCHETHYFVQLIHNSKKKNLGVIQMEWWLRALTGLTKDLGSVPSAHIRQLINPVLGI